MKYGLPYKGSKNKLAERIVALLPKRTHLIDLFCGGCAISHAALVRGKFEHIHINDINWMCPTLFIDALNGKYNDETRWISREDFERLKGEDPYVAFVWSFGNNLRTYLYSKEIEPFKRALHYAIFFADYEPAKEFDLDLAFLDALDKKDYQKRYFAVKHYIATLTITPPEQVGISRATLCNDCNLPKHQTFSNKRPSEMQHLECYSRMLHFKKKKYLQYISEYHPLERRNRLMAIAIQRTAPSLAKIFGGGKICPLPQVCLTMPRLRYQRTA